jgi:multimeric flavodoxin WrbA
MSLELFDPASTAHLAAFACSPRAGGNSDKALEIYVRGLQEAGGTVQKIHLRQYNVHPCIGCNRCAYDAERRCFLTSLDQSGILFQALLSAPRVLFTAPIYYYHLPAIFKAFIDRGQRYYMSKQAGDPLVEELPRRTADVVLVAGRQRGQKLFDGSLLTLRYFLHPFNIRLAEPLLFPGVDEPGDLAQNVEARELILERGREAGRDLAFRASQAPGGPAGGNEGGAAPQP